MGLLDGAVDMHEGLPTCISEPLKRSGSHMKAPAAVSGFPVSGASGETLPSAHPVSRQVP